MTTVGAPDPRLPVRVGAFGPFDLVSDHVHALYCGSHDDTAVRAAAAALLVVEPAGDGRTAAYLRYIACLALEKSCSWQRLRHAAHDLLERLTPSDGPFWRAKALGLIARAELQLGDLLPALDHLATGYGLVVDHEGDDYNRGSACQILAASLQAALLFGPAVDLLRTSARLDGGRDETTAFTVLDEAVARMSWALLLELLGRDAAASQGYRRSASCAARALALGSRGHPVVLQAEGMLQVAYQRLDLGPVDRALLERHAACNPGPEALLSRLALASVMARDGELPAARELLHEVAEDARERRESVPEWTACAWLAELEEHEHGSTEETQRWKAVAMRSLDQLWRDRSGRFEHVLTRHRMGRLATELAAEDALARTDPLTGVGNRRVLDRLTASPLHAGGPAVVLDVDGFKLVNDAFGHEVGDAVLARVATALVALCRGADTVVRTGGDEFVVLLQPGRDAAGFAVRARTAVAELDWQTLAPGLRVTVSTGASGGGPDPVGRADAALLLGRGGRRRVSPRGTIAR